MNKEKVKRICINRKRLSHSIARKVHRQLLKNPEVCDGCNIRPCALAMYLYGKRQQDSNSITAEFPLKSK